MAIGKVSKFKKRTRQKTSASNKKSADLTDRFQSDKPAIIYVLYSGICFDIGRKTFILAPFFFEKAFNLFHMLTVIVEEENCYKV